MPIPKKSVQCPVCRGSGLIDGTCRNCGGDGLEYHSIFSPNDPCERCGGTGRGLEDCSRCKGTGQFSELCFSRQMIFPIIIRVSPILAIIAIATAVYRTSYLDEDASRSLGAGLVLLGLGYLFLGGAWSNFRRSKEAGEEGDAAGQMGPGCLSFVFLLIGLPLFAFGLVLSFAIILR